MKPFGIGIDIVDITRKEFKNPDFCHRFMTESEFNNYLSSTNKIMYATGIWCLKEAIIKATNHKFVFSKINIEFTNEAPICLLNNLQLFLSISYENKIVTAIAISYKTNENE